jgi:Bacterial pre-peptidase C-terminal domain
MNGPYQLTIESAPALPDPIATSAAAISETTRWSEFNRELVAGGARIGGVYFDDFRVTLTAGQEIFVRLDSTDFDPVVQIYDAANREGDYLVADDDSGPGRNSLLLYRAPAAGEYVVRVTTYSDRLPTGRYTLRIGL